MRPGSSPGGSTKLYDGEYIMTLSFNPDQSFVDMVMSLPDQVITDFFESMGIEINLQDEDEGLLYDCEA